MKKSLLFTFLVALSAIVFAQPCSKLFISEYVEGSGNNKAIEIYNPTDQPIDLSDYQLVRYGNGGVTPNAVQLGGTIQPKDTWVAVLDKRDPNGTGQETPVDLELQAKADTFLCPVYDINKMMYFNGNDAVTLEKLGGIEILDIICRVGNPDPEYGWTDVTDTTIIYNVGGIPTQYTIVDYIVGPLFWMSWTQNNTLIRKNTVLNGVVNNPGVFNVAVEWDSIPSDSFGNLGFHNCDCGLSTDFTSDTTSQCQHENISFYIIDYGFVFDSIVWLLPGGTPEVSYDLNPVVLYQEPGYFDVSLKTYYGSDSLIITKEDYIQIIPLPSIPAIPTGDEFVCYNQGSSEYYSNTLSGIWDLTPSSSGTLTMVDSLCTISWNASFAGEAFLKVKNLNECGESEFSEALHITKSNNSISIDLDVDFILCPGESVMLEPEISGGFAPYVFQWEPDYVFDNATSATPIFSSTESTEIEIAITDNEGCVTTQEYIIHVDDQDYNLAFTAFPTQFTADPFNVQFDNLTPDQNNYNFVWHFGNGDSSTLVQPNYTYTKNGLYSVSLIAISKLSGCIDTLVKEDLITCTGSSFIGEIDQNQFIYWVDQSEQSLNLSFSSQPSDMHVGIYNLFGETLFSSYLVQSSFKISLTRFPPAVYVLTLRKGNTLFSGKILLAR